MAGNVLLRTVGMVDKYRLTSKSGGQDKELVIDRAGVAVTQEAADKIVEQGAKDHVALAYESIEEKKKEA